MLTYFQKFSTWGLCLLLVSPVYGGNLASQLPDIGTVGSSTLTPREEKQLGHEFMRNIRKNLQLLEDPLAVSYLQNLADRLQPKLGELDQDITVFLVDDPTINAFAGPGGYIGIHTGLFLAASREGELASVMAHEIAHVSQRHLVRAFEASQKMSLSTMGAIIAGIILGSSNPEISEAVIASSVAGSAQQQLTYSRSHEQEADRVGLELLANADFDPRLMVSFFEVLQQRQRTISSSAPEFLRTHPLTLARIADTRNRASQYPKNSQSDESFFQLMQARIANLSSNTDSNPFNQLNKTRVTSKQATQYYKALAAAKAGNIALARKQMSLLLQAKTQRVIYYFSAATIELEDDKPAKALKITQNALEFFPGNPALVELHARALLQLEKSQQASKALKQAIRQNPGQTYLYPTYAKAVSKQGDTAEAYRALAEQQFRLGNLRQAIEYLNQALQAGNLEKYDRISIEARLNDLKSEVLSREQNRSEESK